MSTTWSRDRLILAVAVIALVPAFGQWLFPLIGASDPAAESVKLPPQHSALVSVNFKAGGSLFSRGIDAYVDGIKVAGGGGQLKFRLEPGAYGFYARSGDKESNVLLLSLEERDILNVECFYPEQMDRPLLCDFRESPQLARISVIRKDQFYGSLRDFIVSVDGVEKFALSVGERRVIYAESGASRLVVAAVLLGDSIVSNELRLDLPLGSFVEVECSSEMGMWTGKVRCEIQDNV